LMDASGGSWVSGDPDAFSRILGLEERVHYEGVVATRNPDGSPHVAAMGFSVSEGGDAIKLKPHSSSQTGQNLLSRMCGTLNITTPEYIVEAALDLGVLSLKTESATRIDASSLADALAVVEFRVVAVSRDDVWLKTLCRPVGLKYRLVVPRPYSRSAGCLVEAAVRASRVEPYASMGRVEEARKLLAEARELVETASRLGGAWPLKDLARVLRDRLSALEGRIGP
jgi:hypothetical protein